MTILKEQISLSQLFVILVLFEVGSSIVVGVAGDAKQDAWLAILLSTVIGVGLVWMYHTLAKQMPGKNLFEIIEALINRPAAIALSSIFTLYFLYIASRVVRDFCELLSTAILPNTPIEVIAILLMFLTAYIVSLGLEVMARIGEIFFPYTVIFLALLSIFLFLSENFHMRHFLPVLEHGWKPIFKAIFPDLIGFPFGETIVLLVLFSQVSNIQYSGRLSMVAVGFTGVLLAYSNALQIAALGVDTKLRANFPLLSAARGISVGQFIERLDAIVVFIMLLGILIKVSVFFYCGLKGVEYIFRCPYRSYVFPFAMLIASLSILIAQSYTEHITEGLDFVPKFMHIPLQIVLPFFLLLISMLKRKKNTKKQNPKRGGDVYVEKN